MMQVGTIIRTLTADTLELVTYVGEAAGGYSTYIVNTGRLVDVLRSKNLETVIRDRYLASNATPGVWVCRSVVCQVIAACSPVPKAGGGPLLLQLGQGW